VYGCADRGLLSDLFEWKHGMAFGIHSTFSDIGGVVGVGLAAIVLAYGIWRAAFVPAALGGCVVAVLLYRWGREPIVVERVSLAVVGTSGRLFGQRRFQLLILAYSLFAFTVQGVYAFLSTLLRTNRGASTQLASIAFASLFAVGIGCRPIAGWLLDRLGRIMIARVGVLLGAVGITTLLLGPATLSVALGIAGFALSKAVFPPVMQAHLMDVFPNASMAGDLGVSRTVYIGIGSLGPAYVGFVAGPFGYPAAFAGFVVALLASGSILLGLDLTG
jgi:MFS family permease